jgi:intracellular sulfur oxidation DsrE/DsrF family protein
MKVMFHLDWDQEEPLLMALNNIKNLWKQIPPAEAEACIVANGPAVSLFKKDRAATYSATVQELHKDGARFLVCRNSIVNLGIAPEDLLEPCEQVPAGILEIIKLQHEGYAYVKP